MPRLVKILLIVAVSVALFFGIAYLFNWILPDPDTELQKQITAYQDSAKTWRDERERVLQLADVRGDSIRRQDSTIAHLTRAGQAGLRRAAFALAQADSLKRLREAETNPQTRLVLCELEVARREVGAAECQRAADSLLKALATADSVRDRRDTTITELKNQLVKDTVQFARADSLLDAANRRLRGCRIPLTRLRCPFGVVNYDLSDGLHFGGGYRVKEWLSLTLTFRPFPASKP